MSDAIDAQPFPRGILFAAGCLISVALAAAATARLTGIGATRLAIEEPVQSMLLRFEPGAGGGIKVFSALTGVEVANLPPHKFGFVGVVLQGFGRDRTLAGIALAAPYRLNRFASGGAGLFDPETGRSVMLNGFGPDNFQAFNQLFSMERNTP